MKTIRFLIVAISLISYSNINAQGVSINEDGSAADSSAMLDVKSTTKGFLPPRLTKTEVLDMPNPAEGLLVYNTTTKTLNVFTGSEWVDMMGNVVKYEIGDYYQGGIIFYFHWNTGAGLVCAPYDQSTGAEWGCNGIIIPGASGWEVMFGQYNTSSIEASCTTPGTAADICANLSLNGYNDWFLPNRDELDKMYQNKAAIDSSAALLGGAAFSSSYYWSSTQIDAYNALIQNFYDGTGNYNYKIYQNRVRAIRMFLD